MSAASIRKRKLRAARRKTFLDYLREPPGEAKSLMLYTILYNILYNIHYTIRHTLLYTRLNTRLHAILYARLYTMLFRNGYSPHNVVLLRS